MDRGVESAEVGAERVLEAVLPLERVKDANRLRKEVGVESLSGVDAVVWRLKGGVLGSVLELVVEEEEVEDSIEGGIVESGYTRSSS